MSTEPNTELSAGTPVRIEMTKWGEQPHWVYPGTYLGHDEHGDWIGFAVGTVFSRPGAEYVATYAQVALVPAADAPDRGWVAAMHGHESTKTRFYVDITSAPTREGTTWRAVDLDLDVVERVWGEVYVDDEDEFAEHQLSYGYPADVVAAAEASCTRVLSMVTDHTAPFDGATAEKWLTVLAGLD